MVEIILIISAYLLGSVSSAIIVCKALRLPDPRHQGSKNPGATNVLRIGGKKAAAIVLAGDALKGFIPVLFTHWYLENPLVTGIVALSAFLGHLWPIFFQFQGGKGVATFFGGLYGINVVLGLTCSLIWLISAGLFKYSSLAALISAFIAPILALIWLPDKIWLPILVMSVLLFYRHSDNIKRLLSKQESKIGQK